jgi:inorganic pyrophosphatase
LTDRSSIQTSFRLTTDLFRKLTAANTSRNWQAKIPAKSVEKGDGDPLDILVLSEHHIPRGDIILKAKPIGGFLPA